jgi:hypothetical protein
MTKRIYLLLLMLSLASYKLLAQDSIYVYSTYTEFKTDKGNFYNTYDGMKVVFGKTSVYFKYNKTDAKFNVADIWGFSYNGTLFRTDKRTGQLVCLVSRGKICYYENGQAYLDALSNNSNTGTYSSGYKCYVSPDLNSPLTPFPSQPLSDARAMIKKFQKDHPEYDSLFALIDKDYDYVSVRETIAYWEQQQVKKDDEE